MRHRLASLGREDFLICTYDSLISAYENNPKTKKNILRITKAHFEFKYLHKDPEGIFTNLTPENLLITPEQRDILIAKGYEIDKWEKGESLCFNNKKTWESGKKGMSEGMI